jgi:hypothetical protein
MPIKENFDNEKSNLEVFGLTPEEMEFLITNLPVINKSFRTNAIAPIETLNSFGENQNSISLEFIGEMQEKTICRLQEALNAEEKLTRTNKIQENNVGLAHNHHTILFDLGNDVYGIIEVDNEPYKIGDEIYIQKGLAAAEAYLILPSLKVLGFNDTRFSDETILLQARFQQSIVNLL